NIGDLVADVSGATDRMCRRADEASHARFDNHAHPIRIVAMSPSACRPPAASEERQRRNHASSRLKTSVALVPPKPKEFDSTVPSLALSMRLRAIGMSAKTGSSSVICALSQMKPLFIIKSE